MTTAAGGGLRTLARAVRLVALLALAGCDNGRTQAMLLARQQAVDPPQLWQVDVIADDGAVRASTDICIDTPIRQTLTRARAESDGEICRDIGAPVVRPGEWDLRCEIGGRRYAVTAATRGDPAQDFREAFVMTPLDHSFGALRQTRRFHRLGFCPSGWRIGDQAKPGLKPRA